MILRDVVWRIIFISVDLYAGEIKEHGMDLSKYDRKHVRITDKWGETFVDLLLRWNHEIKLKNSEFR